MNDSLWKEIKDFGAILSVFRSYAWIIGLLLAAVTWLAAHAHLGLDRIVELDVTLLLFLAVFAALLKQFRPTIRVELAPTKGPSPYRLLRVLNRGTARDFAATCQVISTRHAKENLVSQTVDLKWERTNDRSLRIETGETASLVVAMLQEGLPDGGYRIFIEAWNDAGKFYPRYSWIWNAYSDQTPEADLLIVISGAGAKEPFQAAFRLSVANWPETSIPTSLILTESALPTWLT